MPRHNLNKYKPGDDSTKRFAKRANDEGLLILAVKKDGDRLGCPCGEEDIPGGKSVFGMGHDARFRGKLQRAHMTDTKVLFIVDGKEGKPQTAEAVAKKYGESFSKAIAEGTKRRDEQNRKTLERALNSKRLVKVGRSEETGQVVAVYHADNGKPDRFDIEYVNKQGERQTLKDVPADKAPKAPAGSKLRAETAESEEEANKDKAAVPA